MKQKILSDVEKILLLSRHAPSSHNTQPWQISVEENVLQLGYSPERQLHVGDPKKHELLLSLGSFAETISAAAKVYGHRAEITFLSDNPQATATISLTPASAVDDVQAIEDTILRRRSDRRLYSDEKLPPQVLQELSSQTEGAASLHLFTEPTDISFIAQMTSDATLEAMSDDAFRDELASWIRNNWTRQHDGMPAYVQGIPGPVSLFAQFIIKKAKMVPRDQAKKDSNRVLHSAAVGLVCVSSLESKALFSAGMLYQRLCLLATKYDIKTAGISAAVISDKTNLQLKEQLKLTETPVALVRFGYAKKQVKSSPRLTVEEFMVNA